MYPALLQSGLRPTLALSLTLDQPGEHHFPLPSDSLRTYLVQLKHLKRLFWSLSRAGRQPVDGDRFRGVQGLLLICPWPQCWQKPVLVHSLDPSCTSAEAVTNCRSLGRSRQVAQGQLQASDTDQHQSPSQEAPELTTGGRLGPHQSKIQSAPQQHTQREISADTSPYWREFCLMGSALAQQLVHCDCSQSSQSVALKVNYTHT